MIQPPIQQFSCRHLHHRHKFQHLHRPVILLHRQPTIPVLQNVLFISPEVYLLKYICLWLETGFGRFDFNFFFDYLTGKKKNTSRIATIIAVPSVVSFLMLLFCIPLYLRMRNAKVKVKSKLRNITLFPVFGLLLWRRSSIIFF